MFMITMEMFRDIILYSCGDDEVELVTVKSGLRLLDDPLV